MDSPYYQVISESLWAGMPRAAWSPYLRRVGLENKHISNNENAFSKKGHGFPLLFGNLLKLVGKGAQSCVVTLKM